MSRLLFRGAVALVSAALLASCADNPVAVEAPSGAPRFAISDAARGGQPEFFWLAPTVEANPTTSGTFDAEALSELAVEVCALDSTSVCEGPAIERFDVTSLPTPTRLTLNAAEERYELQWLTGRSGAKAGQAYRVSVLRSGKTLGFVDVMMVRNTPALASVDASRFTGLVAGQQFAVRFRLEQPVARNYVKINEVESNNGEPGDWVELYNTNDRPLDLSGYVFRDNDDSRGYVIPAGTIIPGQGFLVLDDSQFGFGLGAADQARLFAADGTTLADSYQWAAHALTTYGRCVDGTGAFATTSIVTKGSANDCDVLIRINEIESDGGAPADWIELYNPSAQPVSLAGYVLSDNVDANRTTLPAGTTIPANGYLVLEQEQLGFALDAADAVRLYRPNGTALVDSFSWSSHAATTYGRCPDGVGALIVTTLSTKGVANNCTVPTTTVKINEVESNGGTPGDWVELINTGLFAVDLSGYVFRDNDDTRVPYTLPAGTIIAAGGYLVLDEAQFGFGLGGGDAARLFAPGGATLIDSYVWTAHAATTYGRCPNGTGAFVTSTTSTKGAANDCSIAVRINEVESSGGTPGDWVEFYNAGPTAVDLGGYIFRDNGTTGYVIPAGTVIAGGGYLVLDELSNGVGNFTFGLGAADQARLFAPDGTTIVDSYEWTAHATTSYGRCPTGSGPFTTTGAPTKGAANNCGALATAVKINEVESNGGTPGDWVELFNTGATTADLSGYIFRDNALTGGYVIPAGTTLAPGAYLVLEEAQFAFGLGGGDQAQFIAPDGTTVLDSYTWTVHASTTYGRCPNGTGSFATTLESTKGAANNCSAPPTFFAWPGDATVVSETFGGTLFGGNMSGLAYQASGTSAPGVMWAVRNGPGALFRLVWTGSAWARDVANDWGAGKLLRYPNGTGDVDAEGVALVGSSIYVASERNNASNAVSRNSILRYDPSASGTTLTAAMEWDLTADLPANGANLGLEGITFVPDAYLVARGFRVQATNALYNPANYPDHGDGLFFVGVEASGAIHAYALNQVTGSFTRLATFSSGFPAVMDLSFDRELNQFWAICDNGCAGRSTILSIDTQAGSSTLGAFVVTQRFERPSGLPDVNNEGFTLAPQAECVSGRKPAFWVDDNETGGISLRRGFVTCSAF